jgi:hypothetical protein
LSKTIRQVPPVGPEWTLFLWQDCPSFGVKVISGCNTKGTQGFDQSWPGCCGLNYPAGIPAAGAAASAASVAVADESIFIAGNNTLNWKRNEGPAGAIIDLSPEQKRKTQEKFAIFSSGSLWIFFSLFSIFVHCSAGQKRRNCISFDCRLTFNVDAIFRTLKFVFKWMKFVGEMRLVRDHVTLSKQAIGRHVFD